MKNEVKRYTIVIKEELVTRQINYNNSLYELEDKINNYNNKSKNPYFLGDLQYDKDSKTATFTKYKKITIPSTLAEIDKTTTNFKNDFELKRLYGVDERNPRPLQIAYRAKGEIRTLEIVYDKDILDKHKISDKFTELGRDIDFISKVLSNRQIELSARSSIDEFDKLFVLRDKLRYDSPALVNISLMRRFYNAYVYENGKFNYLHYRQLASLVMDHEKLLVVENEIPENKEELEEEVFGQIMMQEFADLELREYYEDLKIATTEGTLDEVYKHRLIPKKNRK